MDCYHLLSCQPENSILLLMNQLNSSDLIIGRTSRTAPSSKVILSHCIMIPNDSLSNTFTPHSSSLSLQPCTGCEFNNTSIKRAKYLIKAAHVGCALRPSG
ncbi:unnamed protein product [Rhizophagus irregularis]|nr:unnamed protein product [Rhizophagus irregularis]